ncbi:UrcA family protein [Erythrobacter sp.]|uniref:UrcA family protein n=1 Tax=Erythrobacter sp. TaxID=1042 RepID=UPI002EC8655D|nr:UrcA family protein [Erythrobacter sp.]
MKTLAILAAGAALTLTAGAALADNTVPVSKSIEYADLNLDTAAGQKALEYRINSAARDVCGADEVRTGTRIKSPEISACLADARSSAKRQVAAMIAKEKRGG